MPAPRLTIDQLPEDTAVSGSEMLVVSDAGSSKKLVLSRILVIPQTALDNHVAATEDAHDASAVSALESSATINGLNVQSQLGQLASGVNTALTQSQTTADVLATHLADADDAHDAASISTTTIAGISGATVQAVLAELAARITALETP